MSLSAAFFSYSKSDLNNVLGLPPDARITSQVLNGELGLARQVLTDIKRVGLLRINKIDVVAPGFAPETPQIFDFLVCHTKNNTEIARKIMSLFTQQVYAPLMETMIDDYKKLNINAMLGNTELATIVTIENDRFEVIREGLFLKRDGEDPENVENQEYVKSKVMIYGRLKDLLNDEFNKLSIKAAHSATSLTLDTALKLNYSMSNFWGKNSLHDAESYITQSSANNAS